MSGVTMASWISVILAAFSFSVIFSVTARTARTSAMATSAMPITPRASSSTRPSGSPAPSPPPNLR